MYMEYSFLDFANFGDKYYCLILLLTSYQQYCLLVVWGYRYCPCEGADGDSRGVWGCCPYVGADGDSHGVQAAITRYLIYSASNCTPVFPRRKSSPYLGATTHGHQSLWWSQPNKLHSPVFSCNYTFNLKKLLTSLILRLVLIRL
jgi:hypothetical protein